MSTSQAIAYLGPVGAGFGFQLAGISVYEFESGGTMLTRLKKLITEGRTDILFVDEQLASDHLDAIARLNENPRPAIILLPNPTNPQQIASTSLRRMMVRAIGSDIFS
ncbi:MAG: V-type ATP synthase subunit F [Candidatus Andersenbacteria bacterium]|nr:V-type ATP synthase subunit F [Candidatus Andersenbacteria bacterium]MBI3250410.1 V-type ATP synthase subunit F [Candidatus Andersenbacteria bacterium]